MRYLLTADLQLRSFECGTMNVDGHNSHLKLLLDGLTSLIERHAPDKIIICGDLFDNKFSLEVDVLDLVHKTFREWSPEIIIIPGNHDTFMLNGKVDSLSQFETYCTVIREPTTIDNKSIDIVPWSSDEGDIKEDILSLRRSPVLLSHFTVRGSVPDPSVGIDPDWEGFAGYKHVILGDIHHARYFGKNIQYLGSPIQHNFGEVGQEKFVWLMDVSNKVELTPIKTNFPKYIYTHDLAEAKELRKQGHQVKVLALSREAAEEAAKEGVLIKSVYKETVATGNRSFISTLEDAVTAYANQNAPGEDLDQLGLAFLGNELRHRSVPPVSIELDYLVAKNFMSYEDLEVTFQDNGMVVVHGELIGAAGFESNGAGKSTIMKAVYFGLYGEVFSDDSLDDLIREGEKSCSVEICYDVKYQDGHTDTYTILRKRPSGLKLCKNTEWITLSSAPATQKEINKVIGDPEFFLRISLLALHYGTNFLDQSDPKKKEFIDKFAGLSVFSEAREQVVFLLKTYDNDISNLNTQYLLLKQKQESIKDNLSRTQKSLEEFDAREDAAAAKRQQEVEGLWLAASRIEDPVKPTVIIEELTERLAEWEPEIKEAKELLTQLREEWHSTSGERADAVLDIKSATDRVKKLQEHKQSPWCPTCKRPFEDVEEANKHVDAEIQKEAESIQVLHKKLTRLNDEHNEKYKPILDDLAAAIVEKEKRSNALAADINKHRMAELAYTHELKLSKTRRETILSQAEKLIQQPRATNDHLVTEVERLRKEQDLLNSEYADLDEKMTDLTDQQSRLKFWETGFGNRGCKSLLYSQLIDRLNDHLQDICNVMTGGLLDIRLKPTTDLKSGDQAEKISLEVINLIGSKKLHSSSLGEQNRINNAVCLALRRCLVEFANYSCNLFFVDEPFTGLDFTGKQMIYELLQDEAKQSFVMVADQDNTSKGFLTCPIWIARKSEGVSTLIS